MLKKIWLLICIICIFIGCNNAEMAKNSTEPLLQVYITKTTGTSVQVSGDYSVYADGKKMIAKEKSGVIFNIRNSGRSVFVQGKEIKAKDIELRPLDSKAIVSINGKKYHGGLIFRQNAGTLQIINLVGLEDYVKGVVPAEMSESWPVEALKAQAVAARTFALYTRDEEKHDGYDLCPTTHCQAYSGIAGEASSVNIAVDATAGEVMQHDGQLIYAAFHSDSGGYTANSEEVWGGNQAYLRSVKDDTTGAPHNKWQEFYTISEVESLLRDNGYYIGTLKEITLTPLKLGKGKTSDRYESGRVCSVRFNGSKGTVSLTGNTMRSIFDLCSTLFDIHISTENKWGSEHHIPKNSAVKIVFEGHGWGHGLGMSQWGAKIMSEKNDYKKILHHFYSDIVIKKMY